MSNRLDAIEARLAALEGALSTAPSVRFAGAWRDGMAYPAGTAVTRAGSLYVAERAAPAGDMPGVYAQGDGDDDRSAWRLAAKRGADGKVPGDVERRLRALEQRP